MQGPHFIHLTNAYVEALGLEKFVYQHSGRYSCVFITEDSVLPFEARGFDLAVAYNHCLYLRASDGLSWDLKR
jgi:hypothetical protein